MVFTAEEERTKKQRRRRRVSEKFCLVQNLKAMYCSSQLKQQKYIYKFEA